MAVPVEGSPAEESRAAPVYPVFLRLDGRRVLLGGGGRAAAASLVVAAAPSEVNRAVAVAAEARGLFVNAVDDAASASALLGGVVHRGGVTVAVSTGGRAPALAGLLREALEAVLPEDVEAW